MASLKKGDFCKVKKSKYLAVGTFVEIVDELAQGIFLCSDNKRNNTIIIAENLENVKGIGK